MIAVELALEDQLLEEVLLEKPAVKMRYFPGWQFSMSDSVANFEQDFACEDRVLLAGMYYCFSCATVNDMSTKCASMIVCIEAVKQRYTSGDIYLDKRICAMMCLYREEMLHFAFIVSMPNSKTLPTPKSVPTACTTANR